jgi:hypothetical protein
MSVNGIPIHHEEPERIHIVRANRAKNIFGRWRG